MSVYVLYRMYDSRGVLLYIGQTTNPPERFKNHKYTKQWWADVARIGVEHCSSRSVLERRERRASSRGDLMTLFLLLRLFPSVRTSRANVAEARQLWESEGRVLAEAEWIVHEAARAMGVTQ